MALERIRIGAVPNTDVDVDNLREAYIKTNAVMDYTESLAPPPENRTAAAFSSDDPTLLNNQTGRETDTGKTKIGDGVTSWATRPYAGGGGGGIGEGGKRPDITRAALQALSGSDAESPPAAEALATILRAKEGSAVLLPDPTGRPVTDVLTAGMTWQDPASSTVDATIAGIIAKEGDARIPERAIAPGTNRRRINLSTGATLVVGDVMALRVVAIEQDGYLMEPYGGEETELLETSVQVIELSGALGVPRLYPPEQLAVAFGKVPVKNVSVAYTFALADAQHMVVHPTSDATARIWTIPANAAVAFPIGTTIQIRVKSGAGAISLAITTDTLRVAGSGSTGSRTIAANGLATITKETATEWVISGVGIS